MKLVLSQYYHYMKHQQDITETRLQVLNFEDDGPDVRKNKHSSILFIKIIISLFLVKPYLFFL